MKLAIKGHATRGKEVIEILEMLGGINLKRLEGTDHNSHYTINSDGYILGTLSAYLYKCNNHIYYTIEEFLEKFPYKVGDKVQHKGATSCGTVYEIEQMKWEEYTVKYTLCLFGCNNYKRSTLPAEYLQPYKEETMEEKKINQISLANCDLDEVEIFLGDKFELKIKGGKCYAVKKQPQYPKTYEECCKVLGYSGNYNMILTTDVDNKLFNALYRLKVCRDAYWRMVGDWKYDVNKVEDYFVIVNKCGRIVKEHYMSFNHILAFPTKEMRDAFFENFKDLIEKCKELL